MTRLRRPRPYVAKKLSGCCRARIVAGRCTECNVYAPWRTRLTEEEAEKIAAREQAAATAKPLTSEQIAAGREALWGKGAYD